MKDFEFVDMGDTSPTGQAQRDKTVHRMRMVQDVYEKSFGPDGTLDWARAT